MSYLILGIVVGFVLSFGVALILHIKTTNPIMNDSIRYRQDLIHAQQRADMYRDSLYTLERINSRREVDKHPGFVVNSEESARVILSRLYHFAKTNPKDNSLRAAVLNFGGKHLVIKNSGE